MNKQENESLSVTENFRTPLKTAKDLKLNTMPCDICESKDSPVRFWGATSALVCNRSECNDTMSERWEEAMSDNKKKCRFDDYYDDDY